MVVDRLRGPSARPAPRVAVRHCRAQCENASDSGTLAMTDSIPPAATATVYDDVPYATHANVATHPDRLWTIATLAGLAPAPATRCRVLELGCGSGDNLIPMAASLPGSAFRARALR